MILYHGSPENRITQIDANLDLTKIQYKCVYATESVTHAIFFGTRRNGADWTCKIISYDASTGKTTIKEQFPGSLQYRFKNRPITIYQVDGKDFTRDVTDINGKPPFATEWVSKPNIPFIPVIRKETHDDALTLLNQRSDVKIISSDFDDQQTLVYFQSLVHIGLQSKNPQSYMEHLRFIIHDSGNGKYLAQLRFYQY